MGAGGYSSGGNSSSQPTYVKRIWLSYGYPRVELGGPYRLGESLSQCDMNKIKQSYLNREFIVSSTTITVQRFFYSNNNSLLSVPFNSRLVNRTDESNVPILQCRSINFDKIFRSARSKKAETSIPFSLSPTNSSIYGCFLTILSFIAIFNCLNNIQTISFWSDNTDSSATWVIFFNIAYSLVFFIYFTVMKPESVFVWIVICSSCLVLGPLVCIASLMHILMYQKEVNQITCNDNLHQMEMDVAYFILTADGILINDKQSHNNWKLLINASCHILNVMMDVQIMKHLTNNNKNQEYKLSQMIQFETEYKINSECLLDYHQCNQIVKQTRNFNDDIHENVDKYFKFVIKVLLTVSIVCFILNYFVVTALFLDDANFNEVSIWKFDFVLYCRIISDLLVLIFVIPYIWYRKYRISLQIVDSGGIHWLDPISFGYFCYNILDKHYGVKFVLNFVCDYCYYVDIYMNNYIIHQTLFALQKANELKGECFLNLLSDDILHILLNYLWFQPNNETKLEKRKDHFDHKELKTAVKIQHNKILERLNQLTFIRNCSSSSLIIEQSQSESYLNKKQTKRIHKGETYNLAPQTTTEMAQNK